MINNAFLSAVFLYFSFALCGSALANVIIYAEEIPGIHQQDGMGVYDLIIKETVVKARRGALNILPPARAYKIFANCQNCCLSPANKNPEFYDFGENIMQTEPMNLAKLYIFVRQGQAAIYRLEDLKDKHVGIRHGMPYGKSVEQARLKTKSVYKIESNIKMLNKGRIDAFLAYVPDAYQVFRTLGIKPYPHDVAHPVVVHSERLVCRGVEVEFITLFNKQLKQLKTSGRLKRILGENYIID